VILDAGEPLAEDLVLDLLELAAERLQRRSDLGRLGLFLSGLVALVARLLPLLAPPVRERARDAARDRVLELHERLGVEQDQRLALAAAEAGERGVDEVGWISGAEIHGGGECTAGMGSPSTPTT
jgi:hypothetical protein